MEFISPYNLRYLPQAHDKLIIPKRQELMAITLNMRSQVYVLDMNSIPAECWKCQVDGHFCVSLCVVF